jgi:hypothetical protein
MNVWEVAQLAVEIDDEIEMTSCIWPGPDTVPK